MSMTSILMTILGIAIFAVGLLFSIAWHELGHLSTAKLFGIRVPQYMVGFGPTVWSRRKGDTEYGIKAIPAGGYIRMIGMFPPGADGRLEARSTSPWRGMIEDARSAAFEELRPGDESRLFYTRKPWKRVIVMFAGPFMNLVLAVAIFMGVAMTFGFQTQTTEVAGVQQCVIEQSENRDACKTSDPVSPAKAAGLQEGDRIVAFDGKPIDDWATLSDRIRQTVGPATLTVERDGREQTLNAVLQENTVAKKDADGEVVPGEYITAGYLGFAANTEILPLSFGDSVVRMGDMIENGVDSIIALPSKIPDLWNAAFSDGERADDSPVGVVGAARIGGEVMNLDIPAQNQVAMMLFLLAGFNLSLFLFNMLPLLPLDGGHIAGALWESLRRNLARVFKRPDPGPFDVAKLMPVAYVVAGIFICFTLLVLVADIVNPVKIT
ncbi:MULTISPECIES: M50 family metallopeptidase [Streptomyces]|uniref:Membrane-associated protease RseP (Regulator of RpoE activity) n=1 Tax=Streptomyces clavifer TaxID=68188 RepID=A0ABS4V4J8_9ACTN|nr:MULTISPECIES: site-2 protease family protein [Streptomyces]KQX93713.1 zinc metalloprotease [Streptomyces sp. Root1319]KQZ18190.1 zinc metalloprotease [Streptomyces sp. Root55]MBP2358733.1 membrane-associated protease RseP (regulator of RpoE activity) [Streptomyces clavifer]MDX2747479.1 site-2 protease family protein [Streptomyces sp. NRRL_B-2557]MDX3060682.1 site-2 protease family protein [Streptomyces sp. ND04-05B]